MQARIMRDSPYMTINEAAKYLCVSPRTVWRRIAEGKLTLYGPASKRLLKREDVEALISLVEASSVTPKTILRRQNAAHGQVK